MEAAVIFVSENMEAALIVAVYLAAVATAVYLGFLAWRDLPKNRYRSAAAVSAWLLAGSLAASVLEPQIVYLAMWLLFAAPIFAVLAFIRENGKLKELDRASEAC